MKIIGKRSVSALLKLWLDILYYIVVVAAVVFAGLAAYYLVAPNPAGVDLDVPIQFAPDTTAVNVTSTRLGVEKSRIKDATGMLEIKTQVRPLVLLYFGLGAVMAAVVLFVLWHLRRIFRSLVDGSPFTLDNARRIRWIAWIVIGGELLGPLVEYGAQLYVMANFEVQGMTLNADIGLDFSTVFAGFVLLVIAELFRVGAGLQKDRDLTV
jgi:hypothetical protein